MNEKNKIEALLFSSGRKMNIEEISELTGIRNYDVIKQAINELKREYEERGSSVMLFESRDGWKLTVKEHYLPVVQKIVTQTELYKPLMETLAVIAWKYPVLQADVIKIRHNKAYDHMRILEEMGFVTRVKFGRTRKITLTDKFFEYFDLPQEKLKEKFADFGGIAKAIKEKEEEIQKIKEEMKKKAEEAGKKEKPLEETTEEIPKETEELTKEEPKDLPEAAEEKKK